MIAAWQKDLIDRYLAAYNAFDIEAMLAELRAHERAAGFDLHFVKPVDAGELLDALRQRAMLSSGRRSS